MEQISSGKPGVRGKKDYDDLWWTFCSNENVSSQRSNPWIKLWLTQLQLEPDPGFSHLRLRSRRVEAPRTARQCWTYWWPQFKLVRFQATKNRCSLGNVLSTIWKLDVSTFGLWQESSWGSNPGKRPVTDTAITTQYQPKKNWEPFEFQIRMVKQLHAACRSWCILHKRNVLLLELLLSQATPFHNAGLPHQHVGWTL